MKNQEEGTMMGRTPQTKMPRPRSSFVMPGNSLGDQASEKTPLFPGILYDNDLDTTHTKMSVIRASSGSVILVRNQNSAKHRSRAQGSGFQGQSLCLVLACSSKNGRAPRMPLSSEVLISWQSWMLL